MMDLWGSFHFFLKNIEKYIIYSFIILYFSTFFSFYRKNILTLFKKRKSLVLWSDNFSTDIYIKFQHYAAATAAKSLQSCLTLCDPIDGSPPGSPVPGILQARTLEWGAISFSKETYFQKILNRSLCFGGKNRITIKKKETNNLLPSTRALSF